MPNGRVLVEYYLTQTPWHGLLTGAKLLFKIKGKIVSPSTDETSFHSGCQAKSESAERFNAKLQDHMIKSDMLTP